MMIQRFELAPQNMQCVRFLICVHVKWSHANVRLQLPLLFASAVSVAPPYIPLGPKCAPSWTPAERHGQNLPADRDFRPKRTDEKSNGGLCREGDTARRNRSYRRCSCPGERHSPIDYVSVETPVGCQPVLEDSRPPNACRCLQVHRGRPRLERSLQFAEGHRSIATKARCFLLRTCTALEYHQPRERQGC